MPKSGYNQQLDSQFDNTQFINQENLQSQYKRCSLLNGEQLRKARNLEELVGIKVHAIDHQLGSGPAQNLHALSNIEHSGTGYVQPAYDLQFDPLQFRQKVPCMADRQFLIKQAILSSSTHTRRRQLNQYGTAKSRGDTAVSVQAAQHLDIGFSGMRSLISPVASANAVFRQPGVTKFPKSGPTEEFIRNEGRGLFSADGTGPQITDNEVVSQQCLETHDAKTQAESHMAPPSESKETAVDPVSALKCIFQVKQKSKKPKLVLNHIMNKYRQREYESHQQIVRQMQTPVSVQAYSQKNHNIFVQQHAKVYKEDIKSVQIQQFQDYKNAQEATLSQETLAQRNSAPQTAVSGYLGSHGVKEKLENLRRLLAEEDINETVQGIQHDWELEDQKILSQQSPKKQVSLYSKKDVSKAEPLLFGTELPVGDLRSFLTKKIIEVQERSNPLSLPADQCLVPGNEISPHFAKKEPEPRKYHFKASTLTHIAELRPLGQEKIENLFIERVFREQTDYQYQQYVRKQIHEFSDQATELRGRNSRRPQVTSLVKSRERMEATQEQEQPLCFLEGAAQDEDLTSKAPDVLKHRTRKQKPQNVLQQQLQRIERINRDIEKVRKKAQEDVRDPEIYAIISEAQNEASISRVLKALDSGPEPMRPHSLLEGRVAQDDARNSGTSRVHKQSSRRAPGANRQYLKKRDDLPSNAQPSKGLGGVRASLQGGKYLEQTNQARVQPQVFSPASKVHPDDLQACSPKESLQKFRFSVSRMVREFNEKQAFGRETGSNDFGTAYASDTELYTAQYRNQFRAGVNSDNRGAGFILPKQQKIKTNQLSGKETSKQHNSFRLRASQQQSFGLATINEAPREVTHGHGSSYFCPKRFNRYPRFTIFFKRDNAVAANPYVTENTVSLSPQFLSFLIDRNSLLRNPFVQRSISANPSVLHDETLDAKNMPSKNYADTSEPTRNIEKIQLGQVNQPMIAPSRAEETIIGWNLKSDAAQNYDPFEKVVLVKGIDNSILTSFRTLKRENNTVSDTFKIVHQKFLPSQLRGLYFRALQKNQAGMLSVHPQNDNEEVLNLAHTELLTEHLLSQKQSIESRDQMHNGDPRQVVGSPPNQRVYHGDMTLTSKALANRQNQLPYLDYKSYDHAAEKRALPVQLQAKLPLGEIMNKQGREGTQRSPKQGSVSQLQKARNNGAGQEPSEATALAASRQTAGHNLWAAAITEDQSRISLGMAGTKKLRPYLLKKSTDSFTDLMPNKQQNVVTPVRSLDKGNRSISPARDSKAAANQIKHQIEVMVLSKIDPIDGAFPALQAGGDPQSPDLFNQVRAGDQNANRLGNLANTTQAGGQMQAAGRRNPFQIAPTAYAPKAAPIYPAGKHAATAEDPPALPFRANVSSFPGSKKMVTHLNAQKKLQVLSKGGIGGEGGIETAKVKSKSKIVDYNENAGKSKYGKDFRIPELPAILQAQLFGNDTFAEQRSSLHGHVASAWLSPNAGSVQYKIKKFIDEIYQKEMKYRYHKQYVREDYLLPQSPIFDLQKFHHVKPQVDLLNQGKKKHRHETNIQNRAQGFIGDNHRGYPLNFSASQSLTNVLAFQAGGPNVVVPTREPSYSPQAGRQDGQVRATHLLPQAVEGGAYAGGRFYLESRPQDYIPTPPTASGPMRQAEHSDRASVRGPSVEVDQDISHGAQASAAGVTRASYHAAGRIVISSRPDYNGPSATTALRGHRLQPNDD